MCAQSIGLVRGCSESNRSCGNAPCVQTPFHHRDPGLLGLLGSDNCPFFSIIIDGIHTHRHAASLVYRAQASKVVLVTDAMAAMGLPPGAGVALVAWRVVTRPDAGKRVSRTGEFELGDMAVSIREGGDYDGLHAVIAGTKTLAGSVTTLIRSVRMCIRTGVRRGCSWRHSGGT